MHAQRIRGRQHSRVVGLRAHSTEEAVSEATLQCMLSQNHARPVFGSGALNICMHAAP